MGYEINSPWTRLRANDIARLNNIIDNKHNIESQIGYKLSIMTTFENLFNEELNNINFDVIENLMKVNNWTWSMYKDGTSYYAVPTKDDMIKFLKREFFNEALYNFIELDERDYLTECGGFVFHMSMIGKYASKDTCFLRIYFDIAHNNNLK
jgi:hypothetical protein